MCYFEQDWVKNSLPSKLLQKVEEGGNNIVYHYRRAQMGMRFGTAQIPPSPSLPFSAPLCHVTPYFDNLSPRCGSRERNGAGRPILLVQWFSCITGLMWQNLAVRIFIHAFPFSTMSLVVNRAERST